MTDSLLPEAAVPTSTAVTAAAAAAAVPSSTGAAAAAPPVAALYVGDLDPNISEAALFEHFQPAGAILSVRVCRDAITRRSLGYGYVNFVHPKESAKAIALRNYSKLGMLCIRVMPALRDPNSRKNSAGNIFIKNLSPEITTAMLHDTFLRFGPILSCKVVMDVETGKSKGYGFVHFAKEDDAKTAIAEFHGKPLNNLELYVAPFLRRNLRIEAMILSFTNVYIKNILPNVSEEDIKKFFAKFGSVTSVCMRRDKQGRVFGFCNFATHTEAVKAIEEAHEKHIDGLAESDVSLYVQRAQKKMERFQGLRAKYEQSRYSGLGNGSNLYVKNFSEELQGSQLRELFAEYGDISSVFLAQDEEGRSRGFGFVCFTSPESASRALRELNGRVIGDRPLYVNVAQRKSTRSSLLSMQFTRRAAMGSMMMGSMMMPPQMMSPSYFQSMLPPQPNMHMGQYPHPHQQQQPPTMQQYPPMQRRGPRNQRPHHHNAPPPAGSSGPLPPLPPHGTTTNNYAAAAHGAIASSSSAHVSPALLGVVRKSSAPITPMMGSAKHGSGTTTTTTTTTSARPVPSSSASANTTTRRTAPHTPSSTLLNASRATPVSIPVTPNLGPLSWEDLTKLTVDEQMNALGERLYVKVAEKQPEFAPKITGMLLEMEMSDLFALLNNSEELNERVKEAYEVLLEYQRQEEQQQQK